MRLMISFGSVADSNFCKIIDLLIVIISIR